MLNGVSLSVLCTFLKLIAFMVIWYFKSLVNAVVLFIKNECADVHMVMASNEEARERRELSNTLKAAIRGFRVLRGRLI